MHRINILLLLLFQVTLFFSCTKEVLVDVAPQLEVTVVDNEGEKLEGADVGIYASESDWELKKNVIVEQKSNTEGVVVFKELETKSYYILVSKGTVNNRFGISKTGDILKENELYALVITIK